MTRDSQQHWPDFAALIDGVIARQTRSNLAEFLERYEHVEFGRKRKPGPEERAMILTAVDSFLIDKSFASLGMTEFANLQERLAVHAGQEALFSTEEGFRIRNACFEAMVCIKALEARLAREADENSILRERLGLPLAAAAGEHP